MEKLLCKYCGKERHDTIEAKLFCIRQILIGWKTLHVLGIVVLTVVGLQTCYGFGIEEVSFDDGKVPIAISASNPAVIQANGFLHGVVMAQGNELRVQSSLADFVSSTIRLPDGTWQFEFDGLEHNDTNVIKLVGDVGQVEYSIIVEPTQIQKQVEQRDTFEMPLLIWIVCGVAGCVAIGVLWWRRTQED